MKAEKPAKGIMTMSQWKDAHCLRIACDCGSREHEVDAWIEVEREKDEPFTYVAFYAELCTPPAKFWQRVKIAWAVLTRGAYRLEHDLILREQAALNLAEAIKSSVKELKSK